MYREEFSISKCCTSTNCLKANLITSNKKKIHLQHSVALQNKTKSTTVLVFKMIINECCRARINTFSIKHLEVEICI